MHSYLTTNKMTSLDTKFHPGFYWEKAHGLFNSATHTLASAGNWDEPRLGGLKRVGSKI